MVQHGNLTHLTRKLASQVGVGASRMHAPAFELVPLPRGGPPGAAVVAAAVL